MIIYSAPRSSPQPLDLCLLSPTTSAYLATWSTPDSYLINDYQSLDQHLSTTLSSPFSCWISACYPLSHRLISCVISAYSVAWSESVSQLISTCQPLDQNLSAAWSHLQSFPRSGSFQTSQFFASGSQSIEASASVSVLPGNIQDLFPLGLTSLISLQSKGLSRVFSNTTVQKHQFFGAQPSLWSNSPFSCCPVYIVDGSPLTPISLHLSY